MTPDQPGPAPGTRRSAFADTGRTGLLTAATAAAVAVAVVLASRLGGRDRARPPAARA